MNSRLPIICALAFGGALAACSPASQSEADTNVAPADTPTTSTASVSHADWAGKWIGVEGMFVEITPSADGGYALTMQSDLDTLGTYTGKDSADGIAFERDGELLLLKAATGDQTGLKYLAGKSDCLMVAQGEGYCRD